MRNHMRFTTVGNAGTPPISSTPVFQQPPPQQQHSPWHSPVPYLFGGLAAMLGLIAFALLILACSYWKLSGYLEGGNGAHDGDAENGDSKRADADAVKTPPVFEEKIVVIMAGDEKPTFLATPMYNRGSSLGDNDKTKPVVDSERLESQLEQEQEQNDEEEKRGDEQRSRQHRES